MPELIDILDSPESNPNVPVCRVGDPDGSILLVKDGFQLDGESTRWVDLKSSPITGNHQGPRKPALEVIMTDGSAGTGYAVDFTGGAAVLPDYPGLDSTKDYTIELWVRPRDITKGVLWWRSNFIRMEMSNGNIRTSVANSWPSTVTGALLANQVHHIVATVEWDGTYSNLTIYVNGQKVGQDSFWGEKLYATDSKVFIGQRPDGSRKLNGVIDCVVACNTVMSEEDVVARYNNGAGVGAAPSCDDPATQVVMNLQFNEGAGNTVDNNCVLGNGHDLQILGTEGTDFDWVEGLTGSDSSSMGIKALAFPPDKITEIDGSEQLPHEWVEGSTVYPHAHIVAPDGLSGDITFKFEYTWCDMQEVMDIVSQSITVTVPNDSTPRKHVIVHLPPVGIDGTGKKISSVFKYCFARLGTEDTDTYQSKVFLLEFDIHVEVNTLGSRQIGVK